MVNKRPKLNSAKSAESRFEGLFKQFDKLDESIYGLTELVKLDKESSLADRKSLFNSSKELQSRTQKVTSGLKALRNAAASSLVDARRKGPKGSPSNYSELFAVAKANGMTVVINPDGSTTLTANKTESSDKPLIKTKGKLTDLNQESVAVDDNEMDFSVFDEDGEEDEES